MRILHYFLGFPPYRTGGLTKYAVDLMEAQVRDENYVVALWPGEIRSYSAKQIIKHRKSVYNVDNYELINPLPIPLDEGIKDIDIFKKKCDRQIYKDFFYEIKPDIVHIHTLMGLHKEFIEVANQLGIRTVYTSHDYFGLCPKVTLYRYGKCCDDDHDCKDCIQCNINSLSLKKIQIMQSPLYRWVKNTSIVKKIRKRHRNHFFEESMIPDLPNVDVERLANKYKELRSYYISIYELIDYIHFNSTVAESIYKRYMEPKNSAVISITHQGIKKHERKRKETKKKVILCLAPAKPFKGWDVLREACRQLWEEGEMFELRVYSPVQNPDPYMVVKENGYTASDLEQMMNEADLLVAPSIWYETFGFTVQEALSYGVPVIVSNHVGAKDIVGNSGIVVEAGSILQLKYAIKNIDKKVEIDVKDWTQFMKENYEMYGAR